MPSRSTCTTVSSTEPTVDRPRHKSQGIREAVEPSQNKARRIGTCSNTSPVDKSCTRLRYHLACGRAHRVVWQAGQITPESRRRTPNNPSLPLEIAER